MWRTKEKKKNKTHYCVKSILRSLNDRAKIALKQVQLADNMTHKLSVFHANYTVHMCKQNYIYKTESKAIVLVENPSCLRTNTVIEKDKKQFICLKWCFFYYENYHVVVFYNLYGVIYEN